MSEISIIVGLGNPGRKYERTRHNVGFMVLDRMAASVGVSFESKPRWEGHVAKLADGLLLVKPQTFMNLSGRCVRAVMNFHKIPVEQLLVVYDDLALPLGRLRLRERGSDGGHNGMKSLIAHLGTPEFPRLRLGIGAAVPGHMVDYVVGEFLDAERVALENMLANALSAIQLARAEGLSKAATRYNQSPKPPTITREHEPELPRPDRPEHKGH